MVDCIYFTTNQFHLFLNPFTHSIEPWVIEKFLRLTFDSMERLSSILIILNIRIYQFWTEHS